ncbi:MAG TPA: hypothetical protein VMU19_04535 [Bryobacteraceae bacterium]|nr:hypothetical protein [Bryobacteraceae bacterium]
MSDARREGSECLAPADPAGASLEASVNPAQTLIRYRVLPNGEFQEALHLGWKGRFLEIGLQDQEVAIGAPLEVEFECMLYLGELTQRDGSRASVRVEHALDRAELATDRDHWG